MTEYKCQFCGYVGGGWFKNGMVCPKCGKAYEWILAQDTENE